MLINGLTIEKQTNKKTPRQFQKRKNLNSIKTYRKIFNLTTSQRNTKKNEILFLSRYQQSGFKSIILSCGGRKLLLAFIAGVNVNEAFWRAICLLKLKDCIYIYISSVPAMLLIFQSSAIQRIFSFDRHVLYLLSYMVALCGY